MSDSVPVASDNMVEQQFGNSPREFSGSKLIISIFVVATLMAASVWIYSYYHMKPFQPLQVAIHRTFPKSYPQVQGGQRKMHRDTPKILRITMQVGFDPESPEADEQVSGVVARLEQLAQQHINFPSYDVFEVHLVQRVPEHKAKTRTITREIGRDSAPNGS